MALEGDAVTPKSFTVAVPDADCWKVVPATLSTPLFPISGGLGGMVPVTVGVLTETTTETVSAAAVLVLEPLVVMLEVLTVPRLQVAVRLAVLTEQVPELAVAETIWEVCSWPTLSVKRTPGTGSPAL